MSALSYKKLELVQGSDPWKAARRKHLTASQVPVVYGLSEHQTPLQLFEEKFAGKEMDYSGKEALFAKGHAAEEAGRNWARANLSLNLVPLVVVSLEHPDLLASLDGLDEEKRIGFEAKLVGREKLKAIDSGEIPQDHLCQVYAQLLATGAESWIYFATDVEGNAVHHTIRPDKAYGTSIGLAAKQFMDKVRKGEAPEPCERDFVQVQDERFQQLAELHKKFKASEAEYKKLAKELQATFKHPRVRCGDISLTGFYRKGNVDYSAIPQLKEIDLEQFRQDPIFVQKFNFKKGEANE